MTLRIHKIVLVGSLALVVTALLAFGGPLAGAASASPCSRFGNDNPSQLSHRHARMAIGCLLNRTRKHHGLHHIRTNGRLAKAAQKHTDRMDRRRCFEHVCPGEASVLTRLERVNYIHGGLRRWLYGENIAYGGGNYGTPRAIVRAWMHSPMHRQIMLDCRFSQLGVGIAAGHFGQRGTRATVYAADFAA